MKTYRTVVRYDEEEYTVELPRPNAPLYSYAHVCPTCAEVWCTEDNSAAWATRHWPIPSACAAHGGGSWLNTLSNRLQREYWIDLLEGAALRVEFMHSTRTIL